MFITCPTTRFKHKMEHMGGVRVILNSEEDEGESSMGHKALADAEEQAKEVSPTPVTHAILTQLKAGECIRHSI